MDPCEPDAGRITNPSASSIDIGLEPRSVRSYLDSLSGTILVGHLVVRGTYLPGTVRCIPQNTRRAPSYSSLRNRSISTGVGLLKCYADVRVNAYILGSGPPRLTVVVREMHIWSAVDEERAEELRSSIERAFIEGGFHFGVEVPEGGLAGREEIMFIGPAVDVSVESWRVFRTWDVQQREDDTVIVVHPHRNLWRNYRPNDYQTYLSSLEMELPAFTQAVTTANQARVTEYGGRIAAGPTYPMLATDVNQLRQYYTDIGAYNHPDGPPAQPPPPCGLAMPDQTYNAGLMSDCQALLAARDTLRGTATLNWSVDTAITSWDGVTTSGTPSRVTVLDLEGDGLTGSVPPELAGLTGLEELRLSGNSLTGCIPDDLREVPSNDLSSLGLPFCDS